MYKRPPLLAACLVLVALGASACGPAGDRGSSTPAPPAVTSASASTPASPPASPSTAPADERGLVSAEAYLKTVREHYPDLNRIADDVLVAHGDALCAAQGQALVDQVEKTKQELKLTGKQISRVLGTAHGNCGRNVFE